MNLRRVGLLLLLMSAALSPAVAQSGPYLQLDTWKESLVSSDQDWRATFRLIIRDDVFSIEIELTESVADLDLYLSDARGDLVALSELTDFNERLYVSRVTDPPLLPGRYVLEVVYPFDRPPDLGSGPATVLPFRVRANATRLEPLATLEPDRRVTGRLLPESGMTALYRIRAPEGLESLRIDISDTDADIDLLLFRDRIPRDLFSADYVAQTLRSSETITITKDSNPPLTAGEYLLLVLDQVTREQESPFTLSVTEGTEAPRQLTGSPDLPDVPDGLPRALQATVEVLGGAGGGGSGTILSPAGLILTNWHVVKTPGGEPDPDITLGLSLDHRRPPREMFQAQVVDYDAERDLALLRVTGGRYGHDLGEIDLPFLEIRDEPVQMAEVLHFIGYPGVGGTGSRASITYTVGVVAGFQQTSYGYDIKTDGEINSGSSGGAALDRRFRLIGVPTSVVGEDAGQLAYVVPVTAIPQDWLELIQSRQ